MNSMSGGPIRPASGRAARYRPSTDETARPVENRLRARGMPTQMPSVTLVIAGGGFCGGDAAVIFSPSGAFEKGLGQPSQDGPVREMAGDTYREELVEGLEAQPSRIDRDHERLQHQRPDDR